MSFFISPAFAEGAGGATDPGMFNLIFYSVSV